MNKKKILFVIPDLRMGGAENSLLQICKSIYDNAEIHILTFQKTGSLTQQFEKYSTRINAVTNSKIKFVLLNRLYKKVINKKFANNIMQKYYKDVNFDTIVAFLEGSTTHFVNLLDVNTKKIAWIHTSLSDHNKVMDYSSFSNVISCSNSVSEQLKQLNINSEVIYNLIDIDKVSKLGSENIKLSNKFNIVTVARFDEAKALDRLINVSNKIYENGHEHTLYIVGHGRLYKKLLSMVKDDHIKIVNNAPNVYKYMRSSDLFVLLSKYEGYGMVIDEALHLGAKVLVTNTNSREAVGFGKYGTICENDDISIEKSLIEEIKNKTKIDEKKSIINQNETVVVQVKELLNV